MSPYKLSFIEDIGVIIPTRGMIFAETFKEIMEELESVPHTIYWSHGVHLPECFNRPLKKALNASHSHILIVEEDMVIAPGTLKALLKEKKDVIACDYPVTKAGDGCVKYSDGDALFSGTGFMLIKTDVLRQMKKPIFRSDIEWQVRGSRYVAKKVHGDVYGKHDINFGIAQYLRGNPIAISSIALGQRKLVSKGAAATNVGMDNIEVWSKLKPAPELGPIEFDFSEYPEAEKYFYREAT